jgi:hypothetical protein
MYAALVTAALFTGIILNDLYSTYDRNQPLKHFLFGFVSTIIMVVLEYFGYEPVAWSLLIVPIAIITSIFISVLWSPPNPAPPKPTLSAPTPAPAPPKPAPKVQLPDTPYIKTICEEVDAQPATYAPAPVAQCDFATDGTPIMPAAEPTVGPFPVTQPVTSIASLPAPTKNSSTSSPSSTPNTLSALESAVKLNLTPVTSCA